MHRFRLPICFNRTCYAFKWYPCLSRFLISSSLPSCIVCASKSVRKQRSISSVSIIKVNRQNRCTGLYTHSAKIITSLAIMRWVFGVFLEPIEQCSRNPAYCFFFGVSIVYGCLLWWSPFSFRSKFTTILFSLICWFVWLFSLSLSLSISPFPLTVS